MAATATPTRLDGRRATEVGGQSSRRRASGPRRRRQLPLVVSGVLLVAGCALAFADASLHLGDRAGVLVLDQPLAAGQVLSADDLQVVQISADSGLDAVPVANEASVLGRPAALSLVAGALLTPAELGPASPVSAGSDLVAVGLKAGAYPPDLAPGNQVEVVAVPSQSGASAPTSAVGLLPATVLAVDAAPAGSGGPTVFSLQVANDDAAEVAILAAAGEASLLQVGAGS